MGGFSLHPLLGSLKVRVTAIHQQGDRLYIGTATGALLIYSLDLQLQKEGGSTTQPSFKLLKTHSLGRRPIDQVGVLVESNQLAVLSDSVITLYSLPDLPKTGTAPLAQARNAHCFAIASYLSSSNSSKSQKGDVTDDIPRVFRDMLLVGCRKKVVVYGVGRGGLKEAWELALPHSPRQIVIPNPSPLPQLPETIHLLYSPTSSVLLQIHPTSIQRLSVTDITTATPPPSSNALAGPSSAVSDSDGSGLTKGIGGMSALTGLGGYVGLGGKGPSAPLGVRTVGGEVLVAREDTGVFYSSEGNFTRTESLQWPSEPDALAFSNPYIYSAVSTAPPTAASSSSSAVPSTAIQIHLSPTLALQQAIVIPNPSSGGVIVSALFPLIHPAEIATSPAKMVLVTTPADAKVALAEGSSIWALHASDVDDEVDNLIKQGRVSDAIGLVEATGESSLSPRRQLTHLRTLHALQLFVKGQYQTAIETFLVFNVNPALIIALYPSETIAGRLHVHRDGWMELFGAVEGARLEAESLGAVDHGAEEGGARALLKSITHLGISKKPSVDTLSQAVGKEDDKASIRSSDTDKPPAMTDTELPRAAIEALMYFLSDRRQKLTGAISALATPLPTESSFPSLTSLPASDIYNLPSKPMTDLDPEQLLRMAQIIYTALIKVYLVARPVLVGSLCRIENWCDVEEVEGLLKAQKKFGDLIDLYQGKKMHSKALHMLHDLAKEEDDKLDRYPPTIRYLQKLGPAELPLILQSSKWVFDEDPKMALQIFTADEPEVEALPRHEVMQYLEKINVGSCAGYLEHIINNMNEDGADFHDKLVELYLAEIRMSSNNDQSRKQSYDKLLAFLSRSNHYRPHRLISRLNGEEMPEARAILLGRMGKHDEALRIYIYTLKDYAAAEMYCATVYSNDPDPHGIFLSLLRIYLRPSANDPILLNPGLELIAKHGIRLDASEVLNLLPPLVTMEDVKAFFTRTLRDGHAKRNDNRVVKQLVSSRKEEVERLLMGLQVKRVRVTDQRICPVCHKRLGQSAIAVHAPRGEVTHLHCKDVFSEKLAKLRI